jgi:hypothetical protein
MIVRGLGDVNFSETRENMVATGTAIALSATPVPTATASP